MVRSWLCEVLMVEYTPKTALPGVAKFRRSLEWHFRALWIALANIDQESGLLHLTIVPSVANH